MPDLLSEGILPFSGYWMCMGYLCTSVLEKTPTSNLLNSSYRVFPGTVESLQFPLSFFTQTWNYRGSVILSSVCFALVFLNHWISQLNLFCKLSIKKCGWTIKTSPNLMFNQKQNVSFCIKVLRFVFMLLSKYIHICLNNKIEKYYF